MRGVTRWRWLGRRGGRVPVILAATVAVVAVAVTAVVADVGVRDSAGRTVDPAASAPDAGDAVFAAVPPEDGSRTTFYPAFAFRPRGTAATTITSDDSRGCVAGSDDLLATELLLPDGATVDAVSLYARPSTGSVTGFLSRFSTASFPGTDPVLVDVFVISTSGTGNQVVTDDTPGVPAQAVLDMSANNYVLQVRSDAAGEWFCGMQVTWTPPPGDVLHAITPCTVFDARPGSGGRGRSLAPREVVIMSARRASYAPLGGDASDCGIRPDARALAMNVNVYVASSGGGLMLWSGGPEPRARTGIWQRNRGESISSVVELSSTGRFRFKNASSGFAMVELVVTGFYAPPT